MVSEKAPPFSSPMQFPLTVLITLHANIKALWEHKPIHLFTIPAEEAGVHGWTCLLTFENVSPRYHNFLTLLKPN